VSDRVEHGPSEAEVLLWGLVVVLPRQENPYIQESLNEANAYLNRRGLTDPDVMRARYEEVFSGG
jgi:hypothetical protein